MARSTYNGDIGSLMAEALRQSARSKTERRVEAAAGCLIGILKVALSFAFWFGVNAVLGQFAGEVLHSFAIDTGFWTQYALVALPQTVIALGVGTALVVTK